MENVFAIKLKDLREKNRYSYQQLAEQIGVAKQSIFKFEKGLANPKSETVLKLSELFNVPYSFFYEDPNKRNYSFANIQFRDGHKISNKEGLELEIKQEVRNAIGKMLELESLLDVDREFNNPLAGLEIVDEKDIEKAAKVLRKKWKLGNDPLADVVEALEGNGIFVVELKCPMDFEGLSGMVDDEYPLVVLNQSCLTLERKRFTALHELGHIVLQFSNDFTVEKVEFFCNYFAGAVLLVDEALFTALGKNRTSISLAELKRIKEVYGISIKAIIVRARNTRFINYSTYQEWWRTYEDWNKEEPASAFGSYRSNETATRFNNLLIQGVTEKRISWSKAAELSERKIDVLKKELGGVMFTVSK